MLLLFAQSTENSTIKDNIMKELKLLRTCDASTNSSSSCNQDTLNFKLLTQNTLENCPQAIHNGK